ncbi:hypothetical protein ACIQTZ_11660 [Paenarthrobacter sp. NPDC090520]
MPPGAAEVETIISSGQAAGWGVGVLEMARAIKEGQPHRASGSLAYHVLA